ncbi:MAG TPA: hypothetical protein VKA25_00025 [Gemmatimonadales bacterium]|nr:hypothetical protein [Gemmatimonadales bacterium]
MGALTLEESILVPALGSAAPGAILHRVLYPAAAPPIARGVHPEPSRRLQRLLAREPLLVNVGTAPWTADKLLGDSPPALIAFGPSHAAGIIPALGPATGGAEAAVALHDIAADATLFTLVT